MPPSPSRDILVFAGQGSNSHWSNPVSVSSLKELLQEKHLEKYESLLRQCKDAFHEELESATIEQRSILPASVWDAFGDEESLLIPPPDFQCHPVFETLSLYLRQILELMLCQSQQNGFKVNVEATGICTGILPAVLAASFLSYTSDAFMRASLETFRLAFWIGLRAALRCRQIEGDTWQEVPSVITVFGISGETLQEKLNTWGMDNQEDSQYHARISATFREDNMSICGSSRALKDIKSRLGKEGIDCRWANVHAIYHGGRDMQDTVLETLADVQRRGIEFPLWDSLHMPLRSTANGLSLRNKEQQIDGSSLLEVALRCIFVDAVNWNTTVNKIFMAHLSHRDNNKKKMRLVGFGPGARALLYTFRDLATKLGSQIETIDSWAEYLSRPAPDDIAIVGLSVNYPGGSNKHEFWQVIEARESTVREIPSSRFDISRSGANSSAQSTEQQKNCVTNFGNFLDDTFDFDASYFNISPREAKSMDPQQRLLLHQAFTALEDAGYSPDSTPSFQRDTFGVYSGVATGDYVDNLRDEIDVYYSPGTLRAFLSGRISYAFKFHGPSMVVDTACSSSLVALYHACVALKNNDCTAALALGVNTISSPDMFRGLSRAHFLSPTGQCKPFDESADGYCRAEGCGAVVLKKLSDAMKEGDHVYGVIRGIGTNQCGTAKSITHPHPETQEALFKSVLKSSRVTPDSISVVEAHGTGTQAGDYAEISSLKALFDQSSSQSKAPLHLSSIKGNIGHAEAASGIAGLVKLLLMMEKKVIPAQASHVKLNPRLELHESPRLRVPTQRQEWRLAPGQMTRRALLNNFGASGSNVALVLEEYQDAGVRSGPGVIVNQTSLSGRVPRSHHNFVLSAKSKSALETLSRSYISYLSNRPTLNIQDICYSATARRQPLSPHRLALTTTDSANLLHQLRNVASSDKACLTEETPPKIVFSFSGQGDIRAGIGTELLATSPIFEAAVQACDALLSEHGFSPVTSFLNGSAPEDGADNIVTSQCACFVLQYALAKLWITWGVSADLVVGHSIGEYAAFAISGAIDWKDALLLVANRALLMVTKCASSSTGMISCRMSAVTARSILQDTDTAITCFNGPQDIVIGGSLESITKVASYCKAEAIKHKVLRLPFGFHSGAMDPILQDLAKHAADVKFKTPAIRVGSSLLGQVMDIQTQLDAQYFVRHAREPVNFADLVDDVGKWSANSAITVVEIGPSGSTEQMFKLGLGPVAHTFLPSLRPSRPSWSTLVAAMGQLFLQGYPLDWIAVHRWNSARFLQDLPAYPLSKSRYFVPFREPEVNIANAEADEQPLKSRHALLSRQVQRAVAEGSSVALETSMKQISRFIQAHTVGGTSLCPASVYLEIILEANDHLHQGPQPDMSIRTFGNVSFEHPLTLSEDLDDTSNTSLRTELSPCHAPVKGRQFTCKSTSGHTHCSGHVQNLTMSTQETTELLRRKQVNVKRLKRSISGALSNNSAQTFSTRTIYDIIFPRVVEYTEPYLTLKQLTLSDSGLEGHGTFHLKDLDSERDGSFITSPAFFDTLLHAAGFMANTHVSSDTACICVSLEQALVVVDAQELYSSDLQVYCSIGDIGNAFIADAYALSQDGNELIAYIEGMCFKKVKLKSFKAFLARSTSHTRSDDNHRPAASVDGVKPNSAANGNPTSRHPNDRNGVLSTRFPIRDAVSALIRELCDLDDDPPMRSTLDELGVDSLLSIDLVELLHKRFSITTINMANCRTVEDVAMAVIEQSTEVDALSTSTACPTVSSSCVDSSDDTVASSVSKSAEDLAASIKSAFISVCCLDPTYQRESTLSLLGVDSLMAIELLDELRCKVGVSVDADMGDISVLTYQQLEDACMSSACTKTSLPCSSEVSTDPTDTRTDQIDNLDVSNDYAPAKGKQVEHHSQCIQQLNASSADSSSLHLFHDGSGLCGMYSRLIGLDRDVYGIFSVESPSSLPSNSDADTMEELAAWYIEKTGLAAQSDIIVGGWSFGGVLAFEVSRQLTRLGNTVKGIVFIDSPAPKDHVGLPEEVVSHVLSNASPATNRGGTSSTAARMARDRLKAQFRRHANMLQNYKPDADENTARCVMIKCLENIDTVGLCGVEYPFLSYSEARDQSIRDWEELVGSPIPVLDISCTHFQIFDADQIQKISKKLEEACNIFETHATV